MRSDKKYCFNARLFIRIHFRAESYFIEICTTSLAIIHIKHEQRVKFLVYKLICLDLCVI